MKKIVYIISNIDKALHFEWLSEEIDKTKFDISFILLNHKKSFLEKYLSGKKIKIKNIFYRNKKHLPVAILKIYFHLLKTKPEIVHTHLFDASLAGLIAAKLAGVKKRIYTRHHSTMHHSYHPSTVKYDRVINFFSTDIVAISNNVKNVLIEKENVPERKIHLIHHGFQLKEFENVSLERIELLKKKYKTNDCSPMIGVISRYTKLKGIQYIIPAFHKLLSEYPNALLILANADGDYKFEIKKMLQNISTKNYIEIFFENDLFALYKIFDVFVHTPVDEYCEAFGQTYIEALAAGVPSVFTLSGIANEFIVHQKNAVVVNYQNSDEIFHGMLSILCDSILKNNLIKFGRESIQNEFALQIMISALEKLYEQ